MLHCDPLDYVLRALQFLSDVLDISDRLAERIFSPLIIITEIIATLIFVLQQFTITKYLVRFPGPFLVLYYSLTMTFRYDILISKATLNGLKLLIN